MKNKYILLILIFSCLMSPPDNKKENEQDNEYIIYEIDDNSFTLQWDCEGNPESYNIYYRKHLSANWIFISNIIGKEYVVIYHDIDKSFVYYDFAVSAVYSGRESELHTCIDNEASPQKWFVKWGLK